MSFGTQSVVALILSKVWTSWKRCNLGQQTHTCLVTSWPWLPYISCQMRCCTFLLKIWILFNGVSVFWTDEHRKLCVLWDAGRFIGLLLLADNLRALWHVRSTGAVYLQCPQSKTESWWIMITCHFGDSLVYEGKRLAKTLNKEVYMQRYEKVWTNRGMP